MGMAVGEAAMVFIHRELLGGSTESGTVEVPFVPRFIQVCQCFIPSHPASRVFLDSATVAI